MDTHFSCLVPGGWCQVLIIGSYSNKVDVVFMRPLGGRGMEGNQVVAVLLHFSRHLPQFDGLVFTAWHQELGWQPESTGGHGCVYSYSRMTLRWWWFGGWVQTEQCFVNVTDISTMLKVHSKVFMQRNLKALRLTQWKLKVFIMNTLELVCFCF